MYNSCEKLSVIRCLIDSVESMQNNGSLPDAMCYVPKIVSYSCMGKCFISVYAQPNLSSIIAHISDKVDKVMCSNNFVSNDIGRWLKLANTEKNKYFHCKYDGWVLLDSFQSDIPNSGLVLSKKDSTTSWLYALSKSYSLYRINNSKNFIPPNDEDISKKLSIPPNNWNFELDSTLSNFLFKYDSTYVDKSLSEPMDPDYSNEWFSFVSASHNDELLPDIINVNVWSNDSSSWDYTGNSNEDIYIKLQIKPGIIIEQLSILVDNEDNCPQHIKVNYCTF